MNKLNEFLKHKIKNDELILRLCKYLKQDKKETEKIVKKVLSNRCFSCGRFLYECNQYSMIVKCYLKDYASWIAKKDYEEEYQRREKIIKEQEPFLKERKAKQENKRIDRALENKSW